jgi:hypothetical protein
MASVARIVPRRAGYGAGGQGFDLETVVRWGLLALLIATPFIGGFLAGWPGVVFGLGATLFFLRYEPITKRIKPALRSLEDVGGEGK